MSPKSHKNTISDIFDNHGAIVLLTEVETGKIEYANKSAMDFYGYSESELLAMHLDEISTIPRHTLLRLLDRAFSQETNRFSFTHILAKGQSKEVEFYTSPISLGDRELLLSIIHDVTDGLGYFHSIIKEGDIPAFVIDSKHDIVLWNNACERLTGIGEDLALGTQAHRKIFSCKEGMSIADYLIDKVGLNTLLEILGDRVNKTNNGITYSGWFEIEGRRLYLDIKASSVYRNSGRLQGVVCYILDRTSGKLAEDRLRRELLMAEQAQMLSLPNSMECSGCRLDVLYRPNYHVSGDLISYTWGVKGDSMFGLVADNMGHGLYTALQSSALELLFRQMVLKGNSLEEIMIALNHEVCDYFAEDSIVASMLFELDFEGRVIKCCSGGINHFGLHSNGSFELIKTPGIFLGVQKNEKFDVLTLPLHRGDGLIFATDGLWDMAPKRGLGKLNTYEELWDFLEVITETYESRDDISAIGILNK